MDTAVYGTVTLYTIDGTRLMFKHDTRHEDVVQTSMQTHTPAQQGITHVQQATELGEALKELNKDEIDNNTRTSSIDMRAILHEMQVHPVSAFEGFVVLGMVTTRCLGVSRQIKRNSCSIKGKGREQIVQTTQSKNETDINKANGVSGGFFSKFMGNNNNKGE